MPLRGKRRAISAKASENESQEQPEGTDENNAADASATQNSVKITRRTRKKKDGASEGKKTRVKRTLSRLPDMPLDILFEIFFYLGPMDLLNITRTTKAFRQLLMNRSNVSVWTKALKQDPDLPKCPDDLNEVEYTRLVYDNHCYFCGAMVKSAYWASRVRCCKRCFKDEFIDETWTRVLIDRLPLWLETDTFVVSEKPPHRKAVYFLRTAVEAAAAELKATGLVLTSWHGGIGECFEYVQERHAIVQEIQESAEALQYWHDNVLDRRTQEIADIRAKRQEAINAKLEAFGLENELSVMEEPLLSKTMEQKWLKDPTELTERRWNNIKDTVVAYMHDARDHRLAVRRARRLEPATATLQNIYDISVRNGALEDRPLDQLPGIGDLLVTSEALAVYEAIISDDEEAVEPQAKLFLKQLPQISDAWFSQCKDTLLALMPPASPSTATTKPSAKVSNDSTCSVDVASLTSAQVVYRSSAAGPHPCGNPEEERATTNERGRLTLATTWFCCDGDCDDGNAIDFPRVLWHSCFTTRTGLDTESEALAATVGNALVLHSEVGPWHSSDHRVLWDADSSSAAAEIIRLCGQDPETTTAAEMDALDARLACVDCTEPDTTHVDLLLDGSPRRPIFRDGKHAGPEDPYVVAPAYTWRSAIHHHIEKVHDSQQWVVFNAADRERIGDARPELWLSDQRFARVWLCSLCRSGVADKDAPRFPLYDLNDHLNTHGLELDDCKEGADYYKAFDVVNSKADLPEPIWLMDPDTQILPD